MVQRRESVLSQIPDSFDTGQASERAANTSVVRNVVDLTNGMNKINLLEKMVPHHDVVSGLV